jgi:hypothetical protein
MIITIGERIRVYLFVLGCVLIGFVFAFWLLANDNPSQPFGSLDDAFISSFLFMLGQNVSTEGFSGFASEKLATFILVVFCILMMILMLNLLIAMMGDAYDTVREKGAAAWRKEQATTIIELDYLYDNIKFPKILHVLKYSSDVAISNVDEEFNENLKELKELVETSGKGLFDPLPDDVKE